MAENNTERNQLSRRNFLKGGLLAGAGIVLGKCLIDSGAEVPGSLAQETSPTHTVYLPNVRKEPTPTHTPTATPTVTPTPRPGTGPKVIHVRNSNATNWNGSGWYGNAVNQAAVDTMVQHGLQDLTNKSSWAGIWSALFSQVQPSGYQKGQGIAIKVNFNNSGYLNGGCDGTGNYIDALFQPVKALIAGLVAAGVNQDDIWIYDATVVGRIIPDRFRTPILSSYPAVRFYGKGDCTGVNAVSHGGHSSLTVQFSDPQSHLSDRRLANVLYNATYLINMPILKKHGISPATLGFKNHFGSLDNIIRGGNDSLHDFINPGDDTSPYNSHYSPLVDIYKNPNIKDKTVLSMGDGLYGASGATANAAQSWTTFGGDAANSLFFAADPVAIDCVMTDFIKKEWNWGMDGAYDYLFCAEETSLGICEGTRSNPGGDPLHTPYGSGYSKIQYARVDL